MNCSFNETCRQRALESNTHNEPDDCVVQPLILIIPCSFDHLKQVIDESIVELPKLGWRELLHTADLVHEICRRQAKARLDGRKTEFEGLRLAEFVQSHSPRLLRGRPLHRASAGAFAIFDAIGRDSDDVDHSIARYGRGCRGHEGWCSVLRSPLHFELTSCASAIMIPTIRS